MGNNCCSNNDDQTQMLLTDANPVAQETSSYVVDNRDQAAPPIPPENRQQETLQVPEPPSEVLEPPAEPPQAPQQQEALPPPGPSLTLEFKAGSETKIVVIREQPIGLQFANRMPLTVSKVRPNCSGAKAGVQDGWVFVKIGATPLEGLSYEAARQVLKTAVQPLPTAGFLLEFLTPSGVKSVSFTTRPLDLTFDNQKMPVTVKKLVPGGQSEKLGVQVGWQISKCNGKDLCNIDFKTFMDIVKEGSNGLPEA